VNSPSCQRQNPGLMTEHHDVVIVGAESAASIASAVRGPDRSFVSSLRLRMRP
jgi:hypothetical protein